MLRLINGHLIYYLLGLVLGKVVENKLLETLKK